MHFIAQPCNKNNSLSTQDAFYKETKVPMKKVSL